MARESAKSTRKAAPAPEVVGEEKQGLDAESGMVLVTTFLLVVAIVLLWLELGHHYGAGPFG